MHTEVAILTLHQVHVCQENAIAIGKRFLEISILHIQICA